MYHAQRRPWTPEAGGVGGREHRGARRSSTPRPSSSPDLGYASTSTRRIADAVGVRQASLYHHFATKDDILDALLAGTVDEPLRLAAELLDEKGSGRAAAARARGR